MATLERSVRAYLSVIVAMVFVLLACVGMNTAYAERSKTSRVYSQAEQWVIRQMVNGSYVVDLSQLPSQLGDPMLSARFLQDLLTGSIQGIKVNRHGVDISDAVVQGSIDLQYAVILYPVHLTNCTFQGTVDLSYSSFGHGLSFDDSTFQQLLTLDGATIGAISDDKLAAERATFFKGASFDMMNVAGSLILNESTFAGPVDFVWVTIGNQFSVEDANFTDTKTGVSFNGVKVAGFAFLDRTTFAGPVDFTGAAMENGFEAKGITFSDRDAYLKADTGFTVSFNGMRVAGFALLDGATFAGPVDFEWIAIGNNFSAVGAHFTDTRTGVLFGGMKVDGFVLLDLATFAGPVDFTKAVMENDFEAIGAHFTDAKTGVSFDRMNVAGSLILNQSTFAGPVNFVWVTIGNHFSAVDAHFTDIKTRVGFGGMKVAGVTYLDGAIFAGPVDFTGVSIGNDFVARNAHFTSTRTGVSFGGMKVAGFVFFDKVAFAGPVNFTKAVMEKDFEAIGAHFIDAHIGVSFNTMKVAGTAYLDGATFAGPVDLRWIAIGEQLKAKDTRFTDTRIWVAGDKGYAVSSFGMNVAGIVMLDGATFSGSLDMGSVIIGSQLNHTSRLSANGATFAGSVDFSGIQVAGSINFTGAMFAGRVGLRNTQIGSDLNATGAHFTYMSRSDYGLDITNSNVARNVLFDMALITATVTMDGATIGGRFSALGTAFTSTAKPTDFSHIKVSGDVDIGGRCNTKGALLGQSLSLLSATCHDLILSTPTHPGRDATTAAALSQLDLSMAAIQGQLNLHDMRIGDLSAAGLRVGDAAMLSNLVITGTLDLANTGFQVLTVSNAIMQSSQSALNLDGMTYQSIQVTTGSSHWSTACPVSALWYSALIAPVASDSAVGRLLCFANQAPYVPSIYENLAAFYQREGDSGSANAVVAEQMRRVRHSVCFTWSTLDFRTCGSALVGWPSNYGRSPEHFLFLGTLSVLIGTFFFRKRNMQATKSDAKDKNTSNPNAHHAHYNELLYSLGLFIPRLHLKIADAWEPREVDAHLADGTPPTRRIRMWRRVVRGYCVAHQGIGYILVVAWLADFSGILK